MLTVGDSFPKFTLKAVISSDISQAFVDVSHDNHRELWKIFFFYPKDFTFVCPTEIMAYNSLFSQFKKYKATIYGVSTDSEFVHLAWRQNHNGLNNLNIPLLSDIRKDLSQSLGIVDPQEGVCLRATFIVDPHHIIRFVSVHDLKVGRNPDETLRTLQALQTDQLAPCNWHPGDDLLTIK